MSYAYNEDKMLEGIMAFRAEKGLRMMEDAERRFQDIDDEMPKRVVAEVARRNGLTESQVMSDSHKACITQAREMVVFILRKDPENYSFPRIGRFFDKHFSTIWHSHCVAARHYESNIWFRETVDSISLEDA